MEKNKNINKFQVLFLLFMLFGYELISFIPGFLGVESRPINIVYRLCVTVLAFIVIIKNKLIIKQSHYILFLFWILYFIRLLYESSFSYDIQVPLSDYWVFSILIVINIFACSTNYTEATINVVKKWCILILLIVNILALYQNIMHPSIYPEDVLVRANANASLNPISFGRTSAVLFFLCIERFENKKIFSKILLVLIMVLSLFNLFLAGSRGPLLQLIIVIVLYLFIKRKSIKLQYLVSFVFAGLIILSFFPQYVDISKLMFNRLNETGFSSNQSDRLRGEFMNSAWLQFLDHPILGDSVETKQGVYPHNIILESLMSMGFIGGILAILIMIIATKRSLLYMGTNSYAWIGAMLIMDVISLFTSGAIFNSFLFWPLLAFTINNQKNN